MSISKIVDKNIKSFIENVSKKYNIEIVDLTKIWNGDQSKSESSLKVDTLDYSVLLNYDKNQLVALCKIHGHKFSGTKSLLLGRLLGKKDIVIKTASKTAIKTVPKNKPILQKLNTAIPTIVIRRNKFNKYEHAETRFIFDSVRKIVIGTQNSDGSVDLLTEEDVDLCNAFKFQFELPHNLDSKLNVLDVKVADLSDDEITECNLISTHEEGEESECDSEQE